MIILFMTMGVPVAIYVINMGKFNDMGKFNLDDELVAANIAQESKQVSSIITHSW